MKHLMPVPGRHLQTGMAGNPPLVDGEFTPAREFLQQILACKFGTRNDNAMALNMAYYGVRAFREMTG
jgi:hypothetical protein